MLIKIILSAEGVKVRGFFGKILAWMSWDEVQSVGIVSQNHLPGVQYSMVYICRQEVTDANFDAIFNDEGQNYKERLQNCIMLKRTRKLLKALNDVYGGQIQDRDTRGVGDWKE